MALLREWVVLQNAFRAQRVNTAAEMECLIVFLALEAHTPPEEIP